MVKYKKSEFIHGDKLFFITGRSKSGNTWMARLLNSHPNIFCDYTENNAFHQDMEIRYFGKPLAELHQHVAGFYEKRYTELIRNGLITNIVSRCAKENVSCYGDKTPRQDVGRILSVFPNARIVIMIRDFRDALVSLAYHRKRYTKTWKAIFSDEAETELDNNFIKEVLQSFGKHDDIQRYLAIAGKKPTHVQIVKYENLKSDPHGVLSDVLGFLHASTTKDIVDRCLAENSFEQLSGGRKEGQEDKDNFFRKGVVGDWNNYFSPSNIEVFKECGGGRALIEAGYESDNNWSLSV